MTGNTSRRYPRTPHLPWSASKTDDDKTITKRGLLHLQSGIPLTVTEKLDGSNYTLAADRSYGRSPDARTNAWDAPMKALWSEIRADIPVGWRICGENMYARHAVTYENLPDVFLVFSIWNEHNVCLGWQETLEWCRLLNLSTVPVIYEGNDFDVAAGAWSERYTSQFSEGFVIRNAARFPYDEFGLNTAKWVRVGHQGQTREDFRHRDDFERNTFMRRVNR